MSKIPSEKMRAIVETMFTKAPKSNKALKEENERLKHWIEDLLAGSYVNCVYCGHRYGPDDEVPVAMAEVLKQHIEQCPEHPMSKLKAQYREVCDAARTVCAQHTDVSIRKLLDLMKREWWK